MMELVLRRTYYETGTNGVLTVAGKRVCDTIELPWLGNQTAVSCIPEGRYLVAERESQRFGKHLYLPEVPGRDLILLHAANKAMRDLKGCIAPVMCITGPGEGYPSAPAVKKLYQLVSEAWRNGEVVFLIIVKK